MTKCAALSDRSIPFSYHENTLVPSQQMPKMRRLEVHGANRDCTMKKPALSARKWLRENGYPEIAAQIDEIMQEWKSTGRGTRRNWWEILAGDKDGNPRTVEGREFPVLRVVRRRQQLPEAEGTIYHGEKRAPPIVAQERWAKGKE